MNAIAEHHGLLDGTGLHVDDSGTGERPVVLIHGWPLSDKSWSEQAHDLSLAGHRVVAYDRRGFGRSEKPAGGYDYDTLADDLHGVLTALDLRDVTLVGFSMGGGEVARYAGRHGTERLHSVVLAAAIPPYLLRTEDNPQGPLTEEAAAEQERALVEDADAFYDGFITEFFSADGVLLVSEAQRREALELCHQADPDAARACMKAFATTDFRPDLPRITVPALVLHGDRDAIVPLEGSGERTHATLAQSRLHVIPGAPHGCNVSHTAEFNHVLLDFLRL